MRSAEVREKACKYYHEHKEKWRRYYRLKKSQGAFDSSEKLRERARNWYRKNIERNRIRARIAYHNSGEDRRLKKRIRYSGRVEIERAIASYRDSLTIKQVEEVYTLNVKRFGVLTCYLCEKPIVNKDDNLEHRVPICRGGKHELSNMDVAHASCNQAKGGLTYVEWLTFKK